MGNQLAATAAVDLANISDDLELIAPLGAEGRNYFASFHCLQYTILASTAGPATSGLTASPLYSSGFATVATDNSSSGSSATAAAAAASAARAEYQQNSLFHAPSTGSLGGGVASAGPSSPTIATAVPRPLGAAGRGRGRGRGGGAAAAAAAANTFHEVREAELEASAAASTPQLPARERAAWHRARWRQRLPVAHRPWRAVPSSLQPELDTCRAGDAAAEAAMDGWCRDTSAASSAHGGRHGAGVRLSPPPPAQTSSHHAGGAAAAYFPNIDSVVAGVSGEWRSNYGHYVQLLLRSGAGVGLTSASAAAVYGGLCVAAPPPVSIGAVLSSSPPSVPLPQRRYRVDDVVAKVFVRTPEDPGQAYFLKYVHRMMDGAGEQLRAVDSTLPRTAPRTCVWYSLLCEGDGFCVLQRPYIAFSLRERLATRPAWTPQEKLFIAYQLLEAVAHLHETYAITHGDIKPNNVMVQSTGVVVLCDMAPFKPHRMPLDSPLLFDYYYDTDESRACYVAPEKFSEQPLPTPPLESKTRGSATYNVHNVNLDGHTASMDVFSTACVLLFLFKEEDPLSLSAVLSLRQLPTAEAREAALLPVLRDANVPPALQTLLLPMLCAAAAEERPSAREVLRRGLELRIFPAYFSYLYDTVWPRLLTTAPDARLLLLHNQLETILEQCETIGAGSGDSRVHGSTPCDTGQGGAALGGPDTTTRDGSGAPPAAAAPSASRAGAVRLLLPLLLQTLHSNHTSDEATYRGLLCLRSFATTSCDFACLVDMVLPHVLIYVNNDAHAYGPATRVLALRLLCAIAERIARHLTRRGPPRDPAEAAEAAAPEEQWALLEHLVLPCLYDVLRQSGQESTAVLVEVASRLPRLLLLARYITEHRQLLYGAGTAPAPAASPAGQRRHRGGRRREQQQQQQRQEDPLHEAPLRSGAGGEEEEEGEDDGGVRCTPLPRSGSGAACNGATEGGGRTARGRSSSSSSSSNDRISSSSDGHGGSDAVSSVDEEDDVAGVRYDASGAGTQQYLSQLRCLLINGWAMLQMLYSHPCAAVVVAVLAQSASAVAAFLGEERVMADLIPLLTTALVGPPRVLRLLYPQAVLLHALLQRPPMKTLRLFVEEGLRSKDDACLTATLDSLALVVRCGRLPLEETMLLVHQSLPLVVESRLWLREAACGVVEAAAQSCTTSDMAIHLEYAVRPLLTQPVPLVHLRRFAATAIRSELAAAAPSSSPVAMMMMMAGATHTTLVHAADGGDTFFWRAAPPPPQRWRGGEVTFKDVLPAVVAVTRTYATGPAPALLHGLPPPPAPSPPEMPTGVPVSSSSAQSSRTHRAAAAAAAAVTPPYSRCATDTCGDDEEELCGEDGASGVVLDYRPTAREAARVGEERHVAVRGHRRQLNRTPMTPPLSRMTPPRPAAAASAAAGLAGAPAVGQSCPLPAPPHSIDVSPLPWTLPPPSSVCWCGGPHGSRGGYPRTRSPPAPSVAAAGTAHGSSSTSALRPTAAALCSVTAHTAAIYAVAPSPSLTGGVVVSAGARGEAFVWQVTTSRTPAAAVCELSIVERVPSPAAAAAAAAAASTRAAIRTADVHTYTACQWMSTPGLRRDSALGSAASTAATTSSVAFASTDGLVRVLDVERNTWVSCFAIGSAAEGGLTGLSLQSSSSLLATTAAGGLHVVDTRCRGGGDAAGACAGGGASVWQARLNALDGAPSCLCPLYVGDRACAAVVGTYGGAVCLYDLRYQLCAQRVLLSGSSDDGLVGSPVSSPTSSRRVSITTACVDPLSTLCSSIRPSSSRPASLAGPSLLLGATDGAVYRLLLDRDPVYWPAFTCHGGYGVRAMLTEPTHGSVFTGTEDGRIRHWSTDYPERSHTLACAPHRSPPYLVGRSSVAEQALAALAARTEAATPQLGHSGRALAALTVSEGNAAHDNSCPPPRHAPDAILVLCAVRARSTTTTAISSPASVWTSGGGGELFHLLSGARDGTLTLWDRDPAHA
ncbi:protein kinase [Novymonas esmeraldas]|uniref:non-specific serine/threonine protein kinase n=1 Tax=Novymonas esmeraldas TaxID=1808958 RepID=A0AAW0EKU4_9TRYP